MKKKILRKKFYFIELDFTFFEKFIAFVVTFVDLVRNRMQKLELLECSIEQILSQHDVVVELLPYFVDRRHLVI